MPRDRQGNVRAGHGAQACAAAGGSRRERDQPLCEGIDHGEIQVHLAEIYDTEVSREDDLQDHRLRSTRSLIDAIVVKVHDSQVANRPVYVAIGVNLDDERDVLGLWLGPSGGDGAPNNG